MLCAQPRGLQRPLSPSDSYIALWLSINGNDRRALVPYLSVNFFRGDAGHNSSLNLSPELDYKFLGRFSSAFSVKWSHDISDNQWYGNFTDPVGTVRWWECR